LPPTSLDLNDVADGALASLDGDRNTARLAFVETLRLFWNTRGPVDIAAVEHELSTMKGSAAAGPIARTSIAWMLDHHLY
jgi:hypothetical protein